MTNILISVGGNCSTNHDLIKEQFTEIIGVDNGAQHLFNRSITPNIVLGDLDSIDPSLLKKIKTMEIDIKSYESNKDKTDFELAIDSGADECISYNEFHEIQCSMSEIYNVKKKLEKVVTNFISTEIEWVALNNANVEKDRCDDVIEFLETLEEDDDVQNVFSNANFGNN